jgi:hypothetical protein
MDLKRLDEHDCVDYDGVIVCTIKPLITINQPHFIIIQQRYHSTIVKRQSTAPTHVGISTHNIRHLYRFPFSPLTRRLTRNFKGIRSQREDV